MVVLNAQLVAAAGGDGQPLDSRTQLALPKRGISDIALLAQGHLLQRLDLNNNGITSVLPLRSCTGLRWLNLANNSLSNLNGLQDLTNLNVLNVSHNSLSSLEDVTGLGALNALIASDNEITSLPQLGSLSRLNTLVVSSNLLSKLGTALASASSLQKLSLSHNEVTSLKGALRGCTALQELRCAHNALKALPPDVEGCTQLRILDAGHNEVRQWKSVQGLADLPRLRQLNLMGNPLTTTEGYREKVLEMVRGLSVLDGRRIDRMHWGRAEDDVAMPTAAVYQKEFVQGQGGKPKRKAKESSHNEVRETAGEGIGKEKGGREETEERKGQEKKNDKKRGTMSEHGGTQERQHWTKRKKSEERQTDEGISRKNDEPRAKHNDGPDMGVARRKEEGKASNQKGGSIVAGVVDKGEQRARKMPKSVAEPSKKDKAESHFGRRRVADAAVGEAAGASMGTAGRSSGGRGQEEAQRKRTKGQDGLLTRNSEAKLTPKETGVAKVILNPEKRPKKEKEKGKGGETVRPALWQLAGQVELALGTGGSSSWE